MGRSRGGELLRAWLNEHRVSQQEIGDRIGMTQAAISKLMRSRAPSARSILLLEVATSYAQPWDPGLVEPVRAVDWLGDDDRERLARLEATRTRVEDQGFDWSAKFIRERRAGLIRRLETGPPRSEGERLRRQQEIDALERLAQEDERRAEENKRSRSYRPARAMKLGSALERERLEREREAGPPPTEGLGPPAEVEDGPLNIVGLDGLSDEP